MRTYSATLNLNFAAISEAQAIEIAKLCAALVNNHPLQTFKVEAQVDTVKED